MACEKNSAKISRLACQVSSGISGLAGKSSFYIGVGVGVAGTLGAQHLTALWRRRKGPQAISSIRPGLPRRIITAAGNSAPTTAPLGSRANPRPIPTEALDGVKGSPAQLRPIPVLSAAPASTVETKLRPAPIQVRTGSGQTITLQNSYQVVRSDGVDTGLAITPYVREGEAGQAVEAENAWGVTHTRSGSLIGGPYESLAQAQGLVAKLAPLRWAAPLVPAAEVARARRIVAAYQPGSGEGGES